jgi:flagellar L-ring protein precursor FlgH
MEIIKEITIKSTGGVLAFLFLFAFGCTLMGEVQDDPAPMERQEKVQVNKKRYDGSLWCRGCQGGFLFADHKARMIGDLITINIVEASSASNQATTETGRKSDVSVSVDSFLGAPLDFGLQNVWGRGNGFKPAISAKSENNYDGSGATSRKGTFSATLTARVMEVLPNGNLRIKGRREITVNNEKQQLVLSGIVRPADISRNNIALSSDIADAQLSFTGLGAVSDKQRPGWMARLIDWVWPF